MQPDAVQKRNKPFECRVILLGALRNTSNFKEGKIEMGDKGKRDKGRKEQQKKAKLSPKEKRKLKKDKKNS